MSDQATRRIVVVGGGPAGIMAAGAAAGKGAAVTLFERNQRLGRKLSITGKGRCNITNIAPVEDIISNIVGNGSFLYSAIYSFDNSAVIAFFEEIGVPTKVERGGRVFPASDRASDVVAALHDFLVRRGVKLRLGCRISRVEVEKMPGNNKARVTGVTTRAGAENREAFVPADAVILATGGVTYPGTGSDGDGLRFARELGHTVKPLVPSLVPLLVAEEWVSELQGLSLRNVTARLEAEGKVLGEEFGEMLFTKHGVSGPIILSLSRKLTSLVRGVDLAQVDAKSPVPLLVPVRLTINLKPALTTDKLDARIRRDWEAYARRLFKNSLDDLLPRTLVPVVVNLSGIDPEKPVHQITRAERQRLVELLAAFPLTVKSLGALREGIVTAGGVSVREVNPRTMASKLVLGLYFAGEILDVDAYTGGFNLQAAFSSGRLAGESAARSIM